MTKFPKIFKVCFLLFTFHFSLSSCGRSGDVGGEGIFLPSVIDSGRGIGKYSSLKYDDDKRIWHVSYYDSEGCDLKYATFTFEENLEDLKIDFVDGDKDMTCEVQSENRVGEYSSLQLDNEGMPWIGYYDSAPQDVPNDVFSPKLKLAHIEEEGWITEDIEDGGVGSWLSMALDKERNVVHFSYLRSEDPPELRYARRYIKDGSPEPENVLVLAHMPLSIKDCEPFDTPVIDSQTYINSEGLRCIDYYEPFATPVIDGQTSIALNSKGLPYITYYDSASGDLRMAWCPDNLEDCLDSGKNKIKIINEFTYEFITEWNIGLLNYHGDVGQYNDIFIDVMDNIHISYLDKSSGKLKYISCGPCLNHYDDAQKSINECCNDPINNPIVAAEDYTIGTNNSIILGPGGTPMISYYDSSESSLSLAVRIGDKWTPFILDGPGMVGSWSSMAASGDSFGISYNDDTPGENSLKFLKLTPR